PGYDLRTSTGPTSGTFSLGHSGPVPTTSGDLILTAVQNFAATFTARTAVPVPEPATFTILSTGIGLVWMIMMRRRRPKSREQREPRQLRSMRTPQRC